VRKITPMLAPNHVARQTSDVRRYHDKHAFESA
jgi:hypothetical protein